MVCNRETRRRQWGSLNVDAGAGGIRRTPAPFTRPAGGLPAARACSIHLCAPADPTPVRAQIPENLCCPITLSIFEDPVKIATGHTFERAAIELWFTRNNTDPMTGIVLEHQNVYSDTWMLAFCKEFKAEMMHCHVATRASTPEKDSTHEKKRQPRRRAATRAATPEKDSTPEKKRQPRRRVATRAATPETDSIPEKRKPRRRRRMPHTSPCNSPA